MDSLLNYYHDSVAPNFKCFYFFNYCSMSEKNNILKAKYSSLHLESKT